VIILAFLNEVQQKVTEIDYCVTSCPARHFPRANHKHSERDLLCVSISCYRLNSVWKKQN